MEALGGSELDKDLLAALDDMLSFTTEADVPPIETGCHLADAFGPSQVPPQPDVTPPTGKVKETRATPYKKPRRRKRPKDELDYLRAQVKTLEEELGKLAPSESDAISANRDDELFSQWKKIAERQKVAADNSLVENLKLRSMLEGQLKMARSLQTAIQHQQQDAAELLSKHQEADAGGAARRPRALSMSDELIFAQLNAGMEAQYAQFDSVMDSTSISKEFQKSHGIKVIQEGQNVAFRQEEARLLPFSMPAVHRAMWSCIRYGKAKELTGRVRLRVVNNDHLNATIVDELQLPGSRTVTTCARLAMRRYFEQNRIVLIWKGCVEVAGSLFVRLHEQGYTSSSPFNFSNKSADSSSSAVPGCVLRMALQIQPEMTKFESTQEAQEHIGEVTDLVVGTYHRNFGLMYQIIERLLFSDATGGEAADEHELERFAGYQDIHF